MFASSEKTTLPIGSAAPSVSALDHNGDPIDLGAALSEKLSLVFFYPKAHTPGCTQQACSLRDAFSLLQEKGVQVFGVSSDSPKTQKSFRNKHALPYILISDKKISRGSCFWQKSLEPPCLPIQPRSAHLERHQGRNRLPRRRGDCRTEIS